MGKWSIKQSGWLQLDTLSPVAGYVCFSVGARKRTLFSLVLLKAALAQEETLTGPLYRLNLIRRLPGSRGVISSSPELHISSLKRSQHDVTPLCVVHSILFAAQTLSFELPIKRRPKIIPQIGAVELEQGEDLESPFSSPPTPLFKGAFLLGSREPVLPTLTWKPR